MSESDRKEVVEAVEEDAQVSVEISNEVKDSSSTPSTKGPTVIITIGMAGSGKTTFMQVPKERGNFFIHSF